MTLPASRYHRFAHKHAALLSSVNLNDPERAGHRASCKVTFGGHGRYGVFAVHTRGEAVQWFVTDAEVLDEVTHTPSVVRQGNTLDEALEGYELEDAGTMDDDEVLVTADGCERCRARERRGCRECEDGLEGYVLRRAATGQYLGRAGTEWEREEVLALSWLLSLLTDELATELLEALEWPGEVRPTAAAEAAIRHRIEHTRLPGWLIYLALKFIAGDGVVPRLLPAELAAVEVPCS